MRVAIVQPNYIPWRGYFDLIAEVDIFVFLDNVQYTNRDWRNRNVVKTAAGLRWLTVPCRQFRRDQLICKTLIADEIDWKTVHLSTLRHAYSRALFYDDARRLLEDGLSAKATTIADLDIRIIRSICSYLGIGARTLAASEIPASSERTARILDIVNALGGTVYVSGPSAQAYLDCSEFKKRGLRLEYKSYDYPPYPQLWGSFEGRVSVLDLISNCGMEARELIRSRSPNEVAIA